MVNLVIKNPSSTATDFKVTMEPQQTVFELKLRLQEQYPTKPNPDQQKLIFAGRLLKNESTLSEVLSQYDINATQTFHLVVSKQTPIPNPTQSTPSQVGNLPPNFARFTPMAPMVNNAQFVAAPLNMQAFNEFYQQQRAAQMNFVPPQNPNPAPQNNANMVPRDNAGVGPFYLLIKLAFLGYILSNGGGTFRTAIIGLGALIIFLYQTGRLQFFAHVHVVNRNQPAPQAPNVNIQPNTQPRTGIMNEINGFLLPFVYSLFPTYNPQQNIQPQPDIPVEQPVVN